MGSLGKLPPFLRLGRCGGRRKGTIRSPCRGRASSQKATSERRPWLVPISASTQPGPSGEAYFVPFHITHGPPLCGSVEYTSSCDALERITMMCGTLTTHWLLGVGASAALSLGLRGFGAAAGDRRRKRQLDGVKIDGVGFSPAAGCTRAPVHESTGLGARPVAPRSEPVHSRTPVAGI